MFHTADPADIKAGLITDVYFLRTLEVLRRKGIQSVVTTSRQASSPTSTSSGPSRSCAARGSRAW
ncbi:MAG: hypothetical protein HYT86_02600 [candidate division NC10 bacterium]|nr:hypothetical protein [candidate division NC10 bacterium]